MNCRSKLLLALTLLLPTLATAQPALRTTLGFSARIADNGRPVTGTHTFVFTFWNLESGGVLGTDSTWTETQTLAVNDGVVAAALGADSTTPNLFPAALFDGSNRWLEVSMDGNVFGGRMAVRAVPYAMQAANATYATSAGYASTAGSATTATSAGSVPWTGVTGKPTNFAYTTTSSVYPVFVERFVSYGWTAGTLVALAGSIRLERDGTYGGLRATSSTTMNSVNCFGVTSTGTVVAAHIDFATATTATVFTDAQAVEYGKCMIGNPYSNGVPTEFTWNRRGTDYYWTGFIMTQQDQ